MSSPVRKLHLCIYRRKLALASFPLCLNGVALICTPRASSIAPS